MQLAMILAVSGALETALDSLLTGMVSESAKFIGLGKALGGAGSIMYIFFRIWGHLTRNEEIDIYPLFRPVALALAIMFYSPISTGIVQISVSLNDTTKEFVISKQATVIALDGQKGVLLGAKRNELYKSNPDLSGNGQVSWWENLLSYGDDNAISTWVNSNITYALSKMFDNILMWIGEFLFNLAALVIKFLQVFFLLMMIITGPITLGLACFEWFYGGLASWVARVIHLLLWLPLVNILGGCLEQIHIVMLNNDIIQLQNTPSENFTSVDLGLVAFYFLGSVGYFMIPTAAGFIVESTGAGQGISQLARGGQLSGAAAGGISGAGAGLTNRTFKAVKNSTPLSNTV